MGRILTSEPSRSRTVRTLRPTIASPARTLSRGPVEAASDALLEPGPNRLADLVRRILLHEVHARHRDLTLVGKAPAELTHASPQDRSRLGVHEELRHRAL